MWGYTMFLEESMFDILKEEEKDQNQDETEQTKDDEKNDETAVDDEDKGADSESKTADNEPAELDAQSFETIFNSDIITMSTLFTKFTTVRNAISNIKSNLDEIKQFPNFSTICTTLFSELDELERLITDVLTTNFEVDKKEHYINLFIYVQGSIRIVSKLFTEMEKQAKT